MLPLSHAVDSHLRVLDMLYAQSIILHVLWYTKPCVVSAEVLSQQLPDGELDFKWAVLH
jgi:hypothetical protein